MVSRDWLRIIGRYRLIILGSVVTALLGRDFAALPNNHLGKPTPAFILLNTVLDLLEGISIIWLYAAIRPRYGAGAKTAVIAAFAWWFIVTLGDATWCSFGFFPASTVIPLMAGTLPALILATLAGCQVLQGIMTHSGARAWLHGQPCSSLPCPIDHYAHQIAHQHYCANLRGVCSLACHIHDWVNRDHQRNHT